MRIVHVGAWNRNWGDAAIQLACRVAVGGDHEWRPYDCQTTVFTRELVEEIERDGPCVWLIGGGGLIWWKPELQSVSGWQWQITQDAMEAIRGRIVVWAVGSPIFPHGDETWGHNVPWAEHLYYSLCDLAMLASTFTVRGESTRQLLKAHAMSPDGVVPDIAWALVGHEPPARAGHGIGLVWACDKSEWRWPDEHEAMNAVLGAVDTEDFAMIHHLADDAKALDDCRTYDAPRSPGQSVVGWWAREMYGGLRCVVSVRKHGIILGAAMGLPVVGLGDVTEVAEICEVIGAPVVTAEDLATPGMLRGAIDFSTENLDSQQDLAREAGKATANGLREALNKAWGEIE